MEVLKHQETMLITMKKTEARDSTISRRRPPKSWKKEEEKIFTVSDLQTLCAYQKCKTDPAVTTAEGDNR
jgi:hypothetical protein